MEKIKLNNQVVHMRKYVKQAKVHSINKLVKEVKLLQNRKGNVNQIQKAQRKAKRYLDEIVLLKKIKPDDISKLALSKARNWKDVLQQKNSTLDERCIAMLANYEAVQKEVEAFHSSNGELVLKISDLVKQWEEKNKYPKNSSSGKIVSDEREKEAKKPSIKTNINPLNNEEKKSDTVKTNNNQFASENEKIKETIFMNDKCNKDGKQSNLPTEPSENTLSDVLHKYELNSDDDDAVENTLKIRESDFEPLKKTIEAKKSNSFENPEENVMEIQNSDIEEESECDDVTVKDATKIRESDFNIIKNTTEIKCLNSDEDLEDNTMEFEESDSDEESKPDDDSPSIGHAAETKQEIKTLKNENVTKLQQSDISEFIKKMDKGTNSTEKKVKAIALLNLDELQELDEIPVDNRVEEDESEEGSSENEAVETSQNKRNDPFFLGCGDEDSIAEEKSTDFPKNNNYMPKNKFSAFSNSGRASQGEKNAFFGRNENSNQSNHSQRFSNRDQFSRKDPAKFKNGRGHFKPFQKDIAMTRNYQDKFQPKGRSTFDRNNLKNQRDFKMKGKFSQNYREQKHIDKPKNRGDKFSAKYTEPHKKGNASDKPLHPSWEAKRKQKEHINTSFHGKRIVFND